ncbi:MarR family winged helix-turn-helix transcriptional regulator, partial [Burkholderia cenocepacia]|uniref:MarR family winged helix-turn-helix transcriptional regulator n=1 Tax=Burkholderia cenocepacia TaxID=95486 RepID=UPI0038CC0231
MTDRTTVAEALEELRLAEARLERRRESLAQPSAIERSVLRWVFERADEHDPATPSDLAEHVGLTRPAMSILLRRMESGGLVVLRPHPGDGRSKIVLPMSRNDHLDGDDALTDDIRAVASRLSSQQASLVVGFLEDLREVVDRTTPLPRDE